MKATIQVAGIPVGTPFTALDPNQEYTYLGVAANETFLIVGAQFDSTNNRSTVKTFKLSDVKFKGEIPKVT